MHEARVPHLRPWLPFLFCLAFAGCPYGSPVAIDPQAQGPVDARLLGPWTMATEEKGFAEIEFIPFDEHQTYAEVRNHEPYKPVELERYRVFSSLVNGRTLLNCRQLGAKKDEGTFLASYEIQAGGAAAFAFVSDDAMKAAGKIASSRGLRRYLEKHLADPGFFEPGFTLKRPDGWPKPPER